MGVRLQRNPSWIVFEDVDEQRKVISRHEIQVAKLIADGDTTNLLSWAIFQELWGIESVAKSIDAHLTELVTISSGAANPVDREKLVEEAMQHARDVFGKLGIRFPVAAPQRT